MFYFVKKIKLNKINTVYSFKYWKLMYKPENEYFLLNYFFIGYSQLIWQRKHNVKTIIVLNIINI